MVKPHQAKSERENDVALLGSYYSSLPATLRESEREVAFQLGLYPFEQKAKRERT